MNKVVCVGRRSARSPDARSKQVRIASRGFRPFGTRQVMYEVCVRPFDEEHELFS